MTDSVNIAVFTGALTAANEALFAPMAGGAANVDVAKTFNWRIIPATAIYVLAIKGADMLSPGLAKGIALAGLVTILFARIGKAPAPAENLVKILGY